MIQCLQLILPLLFLLSEYVPLVRLLLYHARYYLFLHEHLLRFFCVLVVQIVELLGVVRALLVKVGFHFLGVRRVQTVIVLSAPDQLSKLLNVLWDRLITSLLSVSSACGIDLLNIFEIYGVVFNL